MLAAVTFIVDERTPTSRALITKQQRPAQTAAARATQMIDYLVRIAADVQLSTAPVKHRGNGRTVPATTQLTPETIAAREACALNNNHKWRLV